jgi:hypothetical protein
LIEGTTQDSYAPTNGTQSDEEFYDKKRDTSSSMLHDCSPLMAPSDKQFQGLFNVTTYVA